MTRTDPPPEFPCSIVTAGVVAAVVATLAAIWFTLRALEPEDLRRP